MLMLNQAATDRDELAKLLNISDTQLGYITNERASVKIFSGDIGSQRNAKYPPATATIHFMSKSVPSPNITYDHPFVIIHAIPKHKIK